MDNTIDYGSEGFMIIGTDNCEAHDAHPNWKCAEPRIEVINPEWIAQWLKNQSSTTPQS